MQLQVVKDYYGKLLKSSKDLKTSACCDGATIPSHVRPLLDNVHPEVVSKYYGCGLVAHAFALLKPGGELYFSDFYCDRRLPEGVRADPELYGECLGGALYWNDFLPMAKRAGFLDPRLVTSRPIDVANEAMKRRLGQAQFFSATYRLFKLEGLETACEDYGQAVVYRGTVAEEPDALERV
jgi:hypothetical protein